MQNKTPEYLLVGRIIRPHGVRGEVAMKQLTDYPERLLNLEELYVGQKYTSYKIKRIRKHADGMLIHFSDIPDRNTAELLRNMDVFIHIDEAVPLEDGEYYLFQIEGINVVTDDGTQLGVLTNFIETGANDVYVITTAEGKEVLLPAIPDVILDVDLDKHIMTVHLLDGLV